MQNVQQSKSQLAKLLAVENISVQHQAGAKTAWFDVKNRVLTLPVWREMSNDLYDMLVVHEVGHALDTPADGWIDAIEKISAKANPEKPKAAFARIKGFLNVIEDARIDKRQKRRFPGSKRNYLAGYKDLIERDFFGTARRDVNAMSFIDRMNIYFKGGVGLGIKFSAEELPMLRAVEAAETFEEVMALTEKIYLWSKNKKDQEQEIEDQHQYASSDDGDEFDEDDYEWVEADSDETDGEGQGQGKSKASDDEADDEQEGPSSPSEKGESPENNVSSKSQNNGAGETDDDDELPESETEKAWEQKQDELLADSNMNYHYVGLPTFDMSKVLDDYSVVLPQWRDNYAQAKTYAQNRIENLIQEFINFKNSESTTISFMVKEFEMRKSADEYSRTSIAKTGVIDTNKLHSYKYNDDIFRRVATVATGKNHGFVMFLDWSGSMTYNLRDTVKQLLSLAMFCKRVQVPFEVYSFRTCTDKEYSSVPVQCQPMDIVLQPFKLRNLLSSRMKIHELNEAMQYLWFMANGATAHTDYLNSTPLNQAIVAASEVVNLFKSRNKVQIVNTIVLTDGQSDPCDHIQNEPFGKYDANNRNKYILQDRVTKKTYEFPVANRWATFGSIPSVAKTNVFLRVLKDRTGCNLIGFYIHGSSFRRAFEEFHGYSGYSQDFYDENRKSWLNDGFIVSNNSGYDEYYILNSSKLVIEKSELKIDDTMTKGKIAKEFMKFSGNKAVNRVLLQRFVKKIAA